MSFLGIGTETYSFNDVSGAIAHSNPDVGSYALTGMGTGSISISNIPEQTSLELAEDGSTFAMRQPGNYGQITIACQQTSKLNSWLVNWYNSLINDDPSVWFQTSIYIRVMQGIITKNQKDYNIRGVAPKNIADMPYKETGDMITWNLMACEIKYKYS